MLAPPSTAAIVISSTPIENLPLAIVGLAALLYWIGGRRQRRLIGPERMRALRGRAVAYWVALLFVIVALQEPLDGLAGQRFWAHMLEHVILLVVVAPLLALAAPWMRLWRGLPLAWRRPLARGLLHGGWAAPLRAIGRGARIPAVAWALLNLDLIAWHVPAVYDLTLRSEAVHDLEHTTFVVFAVLAWVQVVESPPFHVTLDPPRRVAFALGSMVVGWGLAVALVYSSTPWYAHYVAVAHRHGGLSAMADQQLGGGIMWVPASLPWALVIIALVYRWIGQPSHGPPVTVGPSPPGDAPRPRPQTPEAAPLQPPTPDAARHEPETPPALVGG